jgi:beta-lactamase superfamily II metal-dependent hydrolase
MAVEPAWSPPLRPVVALPGTRSATNLTLHFIDSGQGNCILIECPSGGLILDDCGSVKRDEPLRETHLTINRIVRQYTDLPPVMPRPLAVIASHPDRDHFDMIASSRSMFDPDLVYRVVISETLDAYSDEFQAWVKRTPALSVFPANAHGALNMLHCGLAEIELLTINASQAPRQPSPESRHNADSAVIAIRYNNFIAVLPGDAEGPTQNLVLKNYPGLKATLLAASHHGAESTGSNDRAWARALQPRMVIFSAAFENRFHHPRRTAVENYLAQPSLLPARPHHLEFYDDKTGPIARTVDKAVYTTGFAGSIDVTVDPSGAVNVSCSRAANGGC